MISKFLRVSLTLVFGLSLFALAQIAPAVPNAPSAAAAAPAATGTKVGTINIEGAIFNSNEGRRDFDALTKKLEPKQNELKTMSDEIDSLKKQLNTQGEKMNEDARTALVNQIGAKQKLFDRSVQDAREEAQGQQNEIMQRILGKLAPVIMKYAADNGYGVLLDTSQPWPQGPVIPVAPTMDITQLVVEAYNLKSGVAPPPSSAGAAKPAAGATKPVASPAKPATPPTSKPATPPANKPPASSPPKN